MNLNTVLRVKARAGLLHSVCSAFGSLAGSAETAQIIERLLAESGVKISQIVAAANVLLSEATPEEGEIWPRRGVASWDGGLRLRPSSSSATIVVDGYHIAIDFGRVSSYQLLAVAAALYRDFGDIEAEMDGGKMSLTSLCSDVGGWHAADDERRASIARTMQHIQLDSVIERCQSGLTYLAST